MKFKIIFLTLILIFVSFASQTFAEENSSSSTSGIKRPPLNSERIKAMEERREKIKETKENFVEQIKTIKQEQQAKIKEIRSEFKDKLKLIKDEKKKTTAENIENKIYTFNQNHTQKLSEALVKIQTVLDKIKTKSQEVKSRGLETATVETDITAAQSAIDAAKIAVATQAAKQYTFSITSDATLKQTIGPTVSQFRQDMQVVHKSVVGARQAVHKAATDLAKLNNAEGINSIKTSTPSATP